MIDLFANPDVVGLFGFAIGALTYHAGARAVAAHKARKALEAEYDGLVQQAMKQNAALAEVQKWKH